MVFYKTLVAISVLLLAHVLNPKAPSLYSNYSSKVSLAGNYLPAEFSEIKAVKEGQDESSSFPPLMLAVIYAIGLFRMRYPCEALTQPQMILGTLLMLTGIALRIASFQALGSYFTFTIQKVSEKHVLIESGPYQLLLHPGYIGMLLAWIGFTLIVTNNALCLFATTLIFCVLMLLRMTEEESLMRDLFPDTYATYRTNKYRIIPWIY
jgi:protein-S-isoprenylcysteine O-methyltransferase Ste14